MWLAAILGHLLGDYVFQTDKLAGWKSRSVWGVLAHGGIVTFFTLLCAMPFALDCWPYGLLIGAIVAVGVVSLFVSILFLMLGAPDVAMTEAAIGAGLSTVIFLFALRRTVGRDAEDD